MDSCPGKREHSGLPKKLARILLLILGISLLLNPFQAEAENQSAISETRYKEIQEIIRERVDKYKVFPGIVVGIINEQGTEVIGYGRLSAQDSRQPDGNTVFEIGSITKVFTAILLADLIERGELELDDPISKFLPESVKVPAYEGKQITLFHLATHSSGLPRMPDNFDPADPENPHADYTVKQLYEFLSRYELARKIGARVGYSNYGVGLLGHILTLHTGKDYESLVLERICNPFQMNNTRINLSPEMRENLAPGHNRYGEPVKNWDIRTLEGAGALRSTVNDLLRFVSANLGITQSGLSPAIERTHIPRKDMGKEDSEIGLCWIVSKKYGREIVWHNGGTGGYHSTIAFDKKKGEGVVVLTNSNYDTDDIGFHILETEYPLHEPELPRTEIKTEGEVLKRYVGKYEVTPGVVFDVTLTDEGNLMVQLTGQSAYQVFPESETRFYYKIVDAQIEFGLDEKGQVTHLVLYQAGNEIPAVKEGADYKPEALDTAVEIDPAILGRYAGKYELAPGAIITVTVEEGKLMVQLTGQPKLEVYPESETKFFYTVVKAQITFQVDTAGTVKGLTLHQGGRDLPAKKIE